MSDKEKTLVDQLAELPADVQDRFLLMAQGAAVALDSIRESRARQEEDKDEKESAL